ncbi:hypothetical protein BDA99DRAFT_567277 [Phascolomyces articulosus]|uniref:Uncharacterized protein n=1 Tax=Phascolomyces articulosus TaxID=60185 RepID=A0AAD5PKH2_9FUNG|nr:hypothetical protein BDA99DRAFT_567277 [Phascolomyces articulosus]
MYITYETAHWYMDEKRKCVTHDQPLKTIPTVLPKPDFKPTKLVRISDMKVVDGSQVNEGYCALSYVWNQSGDIILLDQQQKITPGVGKKENNNIKEYKRIDKGKHKIISPTKYTIKKAVNFIQYNGIVGNVKYVQFEGIIQKICQQFNIQYICCQENTPRTSIFQTIMDFSRSRPFKKITLCGQEHSYV